MDSNQCAGDFTPELYRLSYKRLFCISGHFFHSHRPQQRGQTPSSPVPFNSVVLPDQPHHSQTVRNASPFLKALRAALRAFLGSYIAISIGGCVWTRTRISHFMRMELLPLSYTSLVRVVRIELTNSGSQGQRATFSPAPV